MEAFVWDSHFTTGLEHVDVQHHGLVDLINRLGESLIDGEARKSGALQTVFDQLTDYARLHFADEENLMRKSGLDPRFVDLHQRTHAQFVEQLAAMWHSRDALSNQAEALHGYLCSWLGFHILGTDQATARQIALIGEGKTPDQAYEIELAHRDNATAALLHAMQNLYHVLSGQYRDLVAIKGHLEERVAERTRELAQINQSLTDLNQRLESLSNSDGLLGIANRRYFDARLDEEWRRAIRDQYPISLLMIDVDYFKLYNDHYGHPAGDSCLQRVTQAISSALHRPGDLLARYGGEELVVILPHTDTEGAMPMAQSVQRKLAEQPIPFADSPCADRVTVSIGIATMEPEGHSSPGLLIAAADRALYSAKVSGRNRICTV